jgi:hypothetical protein
MRIAGTAKIARAKTSRSNNRLFGFGGMICAARHEAYGPDDSQRRLSAAQFVCAQTKPSTEQRQADPDPRQPSQQLTFAVVYESDSVVIVDGNRTAFASLSRCGRESANCMYRPRKPSHAASPMVMHK